MCNDFLLTMYWVIFMDYLLYIQQYSIDGNSLDIVKMFKSYYLLFIYYYYNYYINLKIIKNNYFFSYLSLLNTMLISNCEWLFNV